MRTNARYIKKGNKARKAPYRPVPTMRGRPVVRPEVKSYDGVVIAGDVDWSGTSSPWSITTNPLGGTGIQQSTNDYGYIGTKLTPLYLTLRGVIRGADAYNVVRMIIIQCFGPTPPTAANLLQQVGALQTPHSPFARAANNRYKVLLDDTVLTVQDTESYRHSIKYKIRADKMLPIYFTDGAGDIECNGIYLYAYSDSSISGHPNFDVYWRLSFSD